MTAEGFEVEWAPNGDGLTAALAGRHDLVVLDLANSESTDSTSNGDSGSCRTARIEVNCSLLIPFDFFSAAWANSANETALTPTGSSSSLDACA